MVLLEKLLGEAGFACSRVDRNGVPNLFAVWGEGKNGRSFGFNGHTDVVPVGDESAWSVDPFGGLVQDGKIWGRGAADMKSGVAAFVAAAIDFVSETPPDGRVMLMITGDEEADAVDGTVALVEWMAASGHQLDACIVAEPSCPEQFGDSIKIGRRGSLTAFLEAKGVQGHSAYPHRCNNPIHAMSALVNRLAAHDFNDQTDHFDRTTLAVTTFDTGNPASNVIPARAKAAVNIRFNETHSSESLTDWLKAQAWAVEEDTGVEFSMRTKVAGESFLTEPCELSEIVLAAVESQTGRKPEFSTSGGTSDARFIFKVCPVVEFGVVSQTIHGVDERVDVEDVKKLKLIFMDVLRKYFEAA